MRATLREIGRLVDDLPEPVCQSLEAIGLFKSWREQIASLDNVTKRMSGIMGVIDAVRSAIPAKTPRSR